VVAPGPIKVNVVALMVAGFIAWLKVAVIIAVLGQVVAEPFGGVTAVTVGGGQAAEAVNDQKKLAASPLPYTS
jgi:hypothetical protein